MPGIADRSMVKNTIRSQQRKLREKMKDIVKQKATQSAYPALSRQDKRIAEFHHDRLVQEQSLQKDTKKAERLARRIAQILDQLRKDFNKIKNFLGDYAFTSTVGKDSECGGGCETDLSAAVDTRQAWKRELENMLTMVYHYVDAQHLGDYALLHQPETAYDNSTCNSNAAAVTSCCPKVYRPFFHYYTPDGDCLSMSPDAGGHSGDSTAVNSNTVSGFSTTIGNFNGQTGNHLIHYRLPCVLGWKEGSVSPAAEGNKVSPPTTHKHTQVTNKDLEIRQLWRLIVGSVSATDGTPNGGNAIAWWSFLVANAMYAVAKDSTITTEEHLKAHFENVICLPATMSTLLAKDDIADTNAVNYQTVYGILLSFADGSQSTSAGNAQTTKLVPPSFTEKFADAATRDSTASDSGAFHEALKHAPTVCNVEDESDLQFIFKVVSCVMDNIRSCQINNDREQQVIDYVRDVSECNEAYHQDVFSDMTSIDESELCQRYAVGKELCSDLDQLYKENCCTKQNFFNDVTLDGCCW